MPKVDIKELRDSNVPYAPVRFLVPIVRIQLEIERLSEHSCDLLPSSSLFPLLLDSKRSKVEDLRRAFNEYTGALQFGDRYRLEATGARRSSLIRGDGLPSVRQTIVSDLDFRDLYRNQVLTGVEDLRGEVGLGDGCNAREVEEIAARLNENMKEWMGRVPVEDIAEAKRIISTHGSGGGA